MPNLQEASLSNEEDFFSPVVAFLHSGCYSIAFLPLPAYYAHMPRKRKGK